MKTRIEIAPTVTETVEVDHKPQTQAAQPPNDDLTRLLAIVPPAKIKTKVIEIICWCGDEDCTINRKRRIEIEDDGDPATVRQGVSKMMGGDQLS